MEELMLPLCHLTNDSSKTTMLRINFTYTPPSLQLEIELV